MLLGAHIMQDIAEQSSLLPAVAENVNVPGFTVAMR